LKLVLFCDDKQHEIVTVLNRHLEEKCGPTADDPRFIFKVADSLAKALAVLQNGGVDIFVCDIYFEEASQSIPEELEKIRIAQGRAPGSAIAGPIILEWAKENCSGTRLVVMSDSEPDTKDFSEELQIEGFFKKDFFTRNDEFVEFLEELS
jgi:hypothetical protein